MEEIIEFFNKAKMFYLATVDGDKPRVRPFGGLLLLNGKVYFNTSDTKDVYKQMIGNPNVELCAFDKGIWLRVEGTAVKETTEDLKKEMFKAQPGVAKMYEGKEMSFQIFSLENILATKNSIKGKEKIIINN